MKKTFAIITGLVLLMLLYAVWLRPDQIISDEQSKARVMQASSQFTEWKGNQIHYTDEGEGPILLMIHGYSGSFYNFQAVSQVLKNDFRVIRVDIPGMGLSDFRHGGEGVDYFQEYRDFLLDFIEDLEIDTFYVMGNSFGGALSALLAAEVPHKVQGLFLLCSAGYDMEAIIRKVTGPFRWKWFEPVLAKGIPLQAFETFVRAGYADDNKIDKTGPVMSHALVNRAGVIQHLSNMAKFRPNAADTSLFAKITAPTVIIWGKEDPLIPVEHTRRFERDIDGSEVKIYSPCGHMPMMELPDSIVRDVYHYIGKWNESKTPVIAKSE